MSWIHALPRSHSRKTRPAARTTRTRRRPLLEALEDRCVPATLTVNTLADDTAADGLLSLREAVNAVNAGSVGSLDAGAQAQINQTQAFGTNDTITFDAGTTGTINLAMGQFTLTKDVTINGPGANLLTLDAGMSSRHFEIVSGVAAELSGMTLTKGRANDDFGGGSIQNRGTLTVTGCTISSNSSTDNVVQGGGGIMNLGTLMVTSSTINGNSASNLDGGGINNLGPLTVMGSTISGNTAGGGGAGIQSSNGTVTITTSTIAGNSSSSGAGGGIRKGAGTVSVTSSVMSGNSAVIIGGIAGAVTLTNSIVAGNTETSGGGGPSDLGGPVTDGGFNIIGDAATSGGLMDGVNGNQVGVDPLLAPLGDYGGPVQTFALLPGSPAIDKGTGTDADARGVAPVGQKDVGSFESQGFSFGNLTGTDQTAPTSSAFAQPLKAFVSANDAAEPVEGGVVTFTPPAAGASADLGEPSARIGADGSVSTGAFANDVEGIYQVTATASGVSVAATFELTNDDPTPLTAVVNSLLDTDARDTVLTLREAVKLANGDLTVAGLSDSERVQVQGDAGLGGTIAFSVNGTISPTNGEFVLEQDVSITGPGADLLTIDAGMASRHFLVNSGVTASLSGMTLTGGNGSGGFVTGFGGSILTLGDLTVTDCTFSANSGTVGGAICNGLTPGAELIVTGSTFRDNTAISAGGAIINNSNSTMTLTASTFLDNTAIQGGGINNSGSATASVTACVFIGNSAKANPDSPSDGGGFRNDGPLTMTACTFSGNTSTDRGGGFSNASPTTAILSDCTFSGNAAVNEGGGLFLADTVTLTNCIVAGNSLIGGGASDVSGTATDGGFNVIGDPGSAGGLMDGVNNNQVGVDPLLSPLGDYGGPVQTFGLLPGSPAIDAGTGAADDARGVDPVGQKDVGAFESKGFVISVSGGNNQSAPLNAAFAQPLMVTVTANDPVEPVAGGKVTFTATASGASAMLSAPSATIAADGSASVSATANGTPGAYQVTASARGATPAAFDLTNTSGGGDGVGPLFLDLNGDGVQQPGERPLANRTVYLDLDGDGMLDDGEPFATTGPDGVFVLEGQGQLRQFLFPGDFDAGIGSPTRLNSTLVVIPVVDDLFQAAGSASEGFIESLYRAVLGREAEQSGVDNFMAMMGQGMTAQQVADAIWNSAEHRLAQIAGYYRDYLGRDASDAEKQGHLQAFLNGATEEQVVLGFLTSAEFTALYPDDSAFVDRLYFVLLGRFRGEGEAPQWEQLVASNGRAFVVNAFLAESECRFRAIDGFYVGLLNREGEEAGRQNWLGHLADASLGYGATATQFLMLQEFMSNAASA